MCLLLYSIFFVPPSIVQERQRAHDGRTTVSKEWIRFIFLKRHFCSPFSVRYRWRGLYLLFKKLMNLWGWEKVWNPPVEITIMVLLSYSLIWTCVKLNDFILIRYIKTPYNKMYNLLSKSYLHLDQYIVKNSGNFLYIHISNSMFDQRIVCTRSK